MCPYHLLPLTSWSTDLLNVAPEVYTDPVRHLRRIFFLKKDVLLSSESASVLGAVSQGYLDCIKT